MARGAGKLLGYAIPIAIIGGGAVAVYLYKDQIGAYFQSIIDSLGGLLGGGGGDGNGDTCTKTCTAPLVLDSDACECKNPACTLTCTTPKVLDSATCACVDPPAGTCTKTCTSPQVLDTVTCTCKNPPPPSTQCWGNNLSVYRPAMQKSLCERWCGGDRCKRYCFCKDCTTGKCASSSFVRFTGGA